MQYKKYILLIKMNFLILLRSYLANTRVLEKYYAEYYIYYIFM